MAPIGEGASVPADLTEHNYTCEVGSVGPADGDGIYVMLRDINGAFGDQWYHAAASSQREILATALAAITADLPVFVYLDTPNANGHILKMFVKRR